MLIAVIRIDELLKKNLLLNFEDFFPRPLSGFFIAQTSVFIRKPNFCTVFLQKKKQFIKIINYIILLYIYVFLVILCKFNIIIIFMIKLF